MSTLLSDTFTRANNVDLGADWAPFSDGAGGGNNLKIVSNAVVHDDAADSAEVNATTVPADHWAEATLGSAPSSGAGSGYGVTTRSTAAGASFGYYRFIGSDGGYEISEWGSGGFIGSLASGSGTTWGNGDRIYGESVANVHTLKKNSTDGLGGTSVATPSDATLAGNIRVGIAYSNSDEGASVASWIAGDFAATPAIASVQPWHFITTQTGILVIGAGFEASQGTGNVIISPSDNVADAGIVNQTITAWADASVTFTAVRSALTVGTTLYLFVKNNTGNSNAAGIPVSFDITGTLAWISA